MELKPVYIVLGAKSFFGYVAKNKGINTLKKK
jgi:hypothetical protein